MKKFLSYVLTFLVVFVLTAATVVSLSTSGGMGNLNQSIGDQSNASSVFSSLLASFQNEPQFNVRGNLAVNYGDEEIDVEVYLNADISDGSNMKFEGFVSISNDKTPRYLEFSYVDNVIYLSFMNNSLKATGSSLSELVGFAKSFAAADDDALGDLLGGIDTNELMQTLMSSLDNIVETELEDGGKQLEMNVEGLASLLITLDSEGKPSQAIVSTEEFEGVSLDAEVYVDFNDYIIVSNPEIYHPERDYVEVGDVLHLVENTIETKELGLNANVVYGDKTYLANLNLDIENKNFTVNALNDYAVTYLNGDLFVDAKGAKLMVSESLLSKLPEFKDQLMSLATEEGITFDKAQEAIEKVSTLDALKILASVKDISSNGKGVTILADGSVFGLDGQVRIFIGVEENKLSKIIFGANINGKELEAEIFISDKISKIEVEKGNYLNIENLYKINKEYFETNQLSLDVALELKGKTELSLNGSLALDKFGDYYSLDADIFYKEPISIKLAYYDSTVFAKLNDIQAKMSKDKLEEIISSLEIDTSEYKSQLQEVLDSFNADKLFEIVKKIEAFEITSGGLYISYDGLELRVNLDENRLTSISVESDELTLNVDIKANSVEREPVKESEYLDVFALAENLKELDFTKGSVSASVNALVKDETYKADFRLAGDKSQNKATLNFNLYANENLNVKVNYEGDVVYLTIGDILIKASKDQIAGLVKEFAPESDNAQILEKLKESEIYTKVTEFISNFELSSLKLIKDIRINKSVVQLTLDKSILGSNNDTTIFVRLNNNMISEIEILNFELDKETKLSVKASVSFDEPKMTSVDSSKYLDVFGLLENLKNLDFTKGSVSASLKALVDGKSYNAALRFAGSESQEKLSLSLKLSGALELLLKANYYDGNAYVMLNNMFVKASKSTIMGLLGGDVKAPNSDELLTKLKDLDIYKKIMDFVNNFEISKLSLFKDIRINSSVIQLTIDKSLLGSEKDTTLFIRVGTGTISEVEVLNLKLADNVEVSGKVALSFNEPTFKEVEEKEKYLDVEKLYDGIINLLRRENVGVNGYVDLALSDGFSGRFNLDIRKKLDSGILLGYMFINLVSGEDNLDLKTTFLGETLYVEICGLKVRIDSGDIKATALNILKILDEDPEKYSTLLNAIVDLLGGESLDSIIEKADFKFEAPKVNTSNINISLEDIVNLLRGIEIDSTSIKLTLDGKLLGQEDEIVVVLGLDNYSITKLYVSGLTFYENSIGVDLDFNYEEQEIPQIEEAEKENYIDLYGFSEAAEPIYKTLKDGSISGTFLLSFMYGEELNEVEVDYGFKFSDMKLTGYIRATFKGLSVNAYFIDNVFYLDVVGLKVYLPIDEIDALKDRLGIKDKEDLDKTTSNIELLLKAKTISEMIHALSGLNLDFINHVNFRTGVIEAYLKDDINIFVTYDDKIKGIHLDTKPFDIDLKVTSYDDVVVDSLDQGEFENWTILVDTFDNIKTTLGQKTFNAHAEAHSYKDEAIVDNAQVDLALDITNGINASGKITVSGNTNLVINCAYQNDVLYAQYENMKLKMNRSAIASLLAIACDLVGIDASTLLGDDYSDLNIKSDAIKEFIPDFDAGNPLNMLYLIKAIKIDDGTFVITLDGTRINTKSKKDMTLKFKTDKTGVKEVDLLNIYTKENSNEYFNFILTFNEFKGVTPVEDNGYIDISDSPDLIAGLINTYSKQDFYISGSVTLAIFGLNLSGLVSVDIEGQIKVVDNKLKMALEISSYPITSVAGYGTDANSNGDGLSRRSISIYYDDGYCYLKTFDKEKIIKDALTREVKLPYQDVLNNIEHYLQWLFGFTDKIMEKIHSAIEVSRTQPIDVSNLLKSYNFDGTTHTIEVNMEAITHDANVGTLSVGFETVNKKLGDDTKEKHYISAIGIDLSLVEILDVKTQPKAPLTVDFNRQTDFTKMDEYIKNFNNTKNPYKEYRTEGSKESLENSVNYSVTLINNNGEANTTLNGVIGDYVVPKKVKGEFSQIVLPALDPWLIDDGKSVKYFEFDGWYNEDGTAFEGTYLLQNMTLVAHWKQVGERFYHTVTFNNELEKTSWTRTILEGESIALENLTKVSHDDFEGERKVHKDYTFNGWLDGEGTLFNNSMTMPSKDIVLTASWNIRVRKYFTITFDTVLPNSSKASITALEGDTINLERLSNHSFEQDETYFEYAFVDWLNEAGEVVSSVVLDRDMIITAKWSDDPIDTYKQKMLSIYSVDANGTSKLAWSGLQKVGEKYSIEFASALNIVDSTRLYRSYSDRTKKYADLFEKSDDGRYIMPDENLTLYISNQFVVTFRAEEKKFNFNLTATLYQGDDINFNDILSYSGSNVELIGLKDAVGSNAKVYDTYAVDYYDYKFLGWNLDGASFTSSVMPGKNIELVASFDEGYRVYFLVKFVVDWYIPDGFTYIGTEVTPVTKVTPSGNEIYVLQGSSFDPNDYYAETSRSWRTGTNKGTYNFRCRWSTTEPHSYSWVGVNQKYDSKKDTPAKKIESMQGELTLFAVWLRV